jgi:hypothetical protein
MSNEITMCQALSITYYNNTKSYLSPFSKLPIKGNGAPHANSVKLGRNSKRYSINLKLKLLLELLQNQMCKKHNTFIIN